MLRLVLLLLSTCGLVMADSYWTSSGSVGTSSQKLECASKCDAEGAKYSAVLESDGSCSCDKCDNGIASNNYMTRGRGSSSSFLIPLTSTANNYEAVGTENVAVTVIGSSMLFTQDSPSVFPVGQKALHLQSSDTRYLKYIIPQSLIDSAMANGFIISFWLDFLTDAAGPIFEFQAGAKGLHVWQYTVGKVFVHTGPGSALFNYPRLTGWHHYAIVFNKTALTTELLQDGVQKGIASKIPVLRTELLIGERLGEATTTNVAIFNFAMEVLGPTDAAAIIQKQLDGCY